MTGSRPIASLSPTLLARKGGAKPAMRPHQPALQVSIEGNAAIDHDLGWNDHGEDLTGPADVVPIGLHAAVSTEAPEVVRQQERLGEAFAAPRRPARKAAFDQGRKAAFTLRLDEDRHLKLRLACAAGNRSAQLLVTEALDRLLAELPEVDELAGALRAKRGS